MSQPTNQPGKKEPEKATHWKTAVYDCNAVDSEAKFNGQWANLDKLPAFVKTLHRKREICPKTQREHYQIHVVCHKQERLAALTGWIKHTKWFKVIGDDHIRNSIEYISKLATTAPGAKVEVLQGEKYYRIHELLLEIAKFSDNVIPGRPEYEGDLRGSVTLHANDWENITLRMVSADITWASKLAVPQLRRMWEDWKFAFIGRVEEHCSETSGAFIIEAPGNRRLLAADIEDSEIPPEIEEELNEYSIS